MPANSKPKTEDTKPLEKTRETIFGENDVTYISDKVRLTILYVWSRVAEQRVDWLA